MDTPNNTINSFEARLLIGAATAALAIVGGALWYTQASASPATVADLATPAPGPVMPDLVGMDVADAHVALEGLGVASTATDTCMVNGCHTAIVECNDGNGGWIDVRATGAKKVRSQQFEPGADLAGVGHVDLISVDYCPLGDFEQPVVDVEPEMPAEDPQPVAEAEPEAPIMPTPAPGDPQPVAEPAPAPAPEAPVPVVESPDEPEIEEPWEDDDEADADDTDDDADPDGESGDEDETDDD